MHQQQQKSQNVTDKRQKAIRIEHKKKNIAILK